MYRQNNSMFQTLENGIKLHYEEYGKKDGKTIIFLHGNGESLALFQNYVEPLKQYHLFLIDSRCHGNSSHGEITYELIAEDVVLFIKKNSLKHVTLIGFSDGAIVSLLVARDTKYVDKCFVCGANLDPSGIKENFMKSFKIEYEKTHDPLYALMINEPHIDPLSLRNINSRVIVIHGENDCIKDSHSELIKNSISNSLMYVIEGSDHFVFNHEDEMLDIIKHEMAIDVYFEDNHVIVVDKKAGVLSQEDKTGAKDILTDIKNYLKWKYHKPGNAYLGLVERLDRNVSGLMVFAKSSKAASRLNETRPEKTYLAVCMGKFDKKEDTIINKLLKDEKNLKAYENSDGKLSKTHYEVLDYENNLSLLKINIGTGRFHQIRYTMSSIGHPIYNDSKYNEGVEKCGFELGLDAYKISFVHPVSKDTLSFERIPDGGIFSTFKTL